MARHIAPLTIEVRHSEPLTILGGDERGIHQYLGYADLADEIRRRFSAPRTTAARPFRPHRVNILIGNTDDHPRNRAPRLGLFVAASEVYQLDQASARERIDATIDIIEHDWADAADDAADDAGLTKAERDRLWRRQFLNPAINYDDSA